MRSLLVALALLALASGGAVGQQPAPPVKQPTPPPPPAVKAGEQAPDFTLRYLARTPDGKNEQKTISLAEFKGKKTVVLAFFPAAFSPG
jgi:hypothetical protein